MVTAGMDHMCPVCSLKELEKEIQTLENGLQGLQDEVTYHHDNPSYEPDDRFMVVMEPFLEEATTSLDKMNAMKGEMKEKVRKTNIIPVSLIIDCTTCSFKRQCHCLVRTLTLPPYWTSSQYSVPSSQHLV